MYNTVIKQLEKALDCKDDKELRLRVEVLVDMLKDNEPQRPVYIPQPQPTQPTYFETDSPKIAQPTVSTKQPRINGAGAITSTNSEQINYKRPKGT